MNRKISLVFVLLLLIGGCSELKLDAAISIADRAIEPLTVVSELHYRNATLVDDTWYISYVFNDGSGPIIVEVDRKEKAATYITLGDEREEIDAFMDNFITGLEVFKKSVEAESRSSLC